MADITLLVIIYLLGSVSSAVIVCHVMNLGDPRKQGSGNPGSTNVLRIGGVKAALFTLIFDILKGCAAITGMKLFAQSHHLIGFAALIVTLGHMFPAYFQLKGGKGVATALGAIIALNTFVALGLAVLWVVIASTWRYASLASVIVTATAPLCFYFFEPAHYVPISMLAAIIIIRHHSNIRCLIKGTENKITSGQRLQR